jgi:hypothetical protein
MTEADNRLRRAGRGRLPDGAHVTWSVADGSRGRRWRWTLADVGSFVHSGLIELDGQAQFARLELATRHGMLTLHPEPDGRSINGNAVSATGVRGLAYAWHPGASLAIAADAFATTILATGEGTATLIVEPRLAIVEGGIAHRLPVDQRGVPLLIDAEEWALEE